MAVEQLFLPQAQPLPEDDSLTSFKRTILLIMLNFKTPSLQKQNLDIQNDDIQETTIEPGVLHPYWKIGIL
jgi:hypothetical protein